MEYAALQPADLKKIIIESGVADSSKVEEAERISDQEHVSFADAVINLGLITNDELARLISDEIGIPFFSLAGKIPSLDNLSLIPEIVARKKKAVAFKKDSEGLHLAMVDPTDLEIINFIERKEGVPVIAYFATETDIDNALEGYGKGLPDLLDDVLKGSENQGQFGVGGSGKGTESDLPIIQMVRKIIIQSYRNRASDIHIEPRENSDSVIRFRIDGVLHDVAQIPREWHSQIVSRIKVMAKLRTDEHHIPQDGKIEFDLDDNEANIDIRVSIVPILEGEKAVLRLLAERSRQFSLDGIGLSEANMKKIIKTYKKPYGMILATGPTGCGKTTTLYSILKLLNKRQINIMTIEDPVEYDIAGVNQIQVNAKAQLTFATGLRSILRQDPNVILVGEIRDKETAGIAVNLALTGHLVLSTLHTNDAATAIPRLIDLGIEPFLVASTVSIVIAQRLVRKIHDNCRTSYEIKASELANKIGWDMAIKIFGASQDKPDNQIRFYVGKGCEGCQGTGYQGRIGIFEVMVVTDEIKDAIAKNLTAGVINEISAKSGKISLLEDGLEKVTMGLTTLDEIIASTKI